MPASSATWGNKLSLKGYGNPRDWRPDYQKISTTENRLHPFTNMIKVWMEVRKGIWYLCLPTKRNWLHSAPAKLRIMLKIYSFDAHFLSPFDLDRLQASDCIRRQNWPHYLTFYHPIVIPGMKRARGVDVTCWRECQLYNLWSTSATQKGERMKGWNKWPSVALESGSSWCLIWFDVKGSDCITLKSNQIRGKMAGNLWNQIVASLFSKTNEIDAKIKRFQAKMLGG